MSRVDARQADALLRLARQVTARHDLDDVLAEVFRCLRPLVEFGGGSIQLIDDDGWIQMAACDPAAPAHIMAKRVPLASSVAGRVILTEQTVYLPDLGAAVEPGQPVSAGVRSYLGVPLVADGRAIGLLQVDAPHADAWSQAQRDLIVSVAPIVAAAIQNARAHARAEHARARAASLEARLTEASALAAGARAAARTGNRLELERQLAQLDALLTPAPDAAVLRLPAQRPRVAKGARSTAIVVGTRS